MGDAFPKLGKKQVEKEKSIVSWLVFHDSIRYYDKTMIDNRQFEQLFKSNYAAMMRVARGMLGDDEESKDVVSDIMLRVGDGRITLPPDSQRYLLTCVRNRCLDVIQHKKTTEKIMRLYPLVTQPTLNIANEQQVYDEILHVVETQLTPQTRKVFELRHDRHLSYQEIADTLDISKAAVYKHLAKAINLLKAHFNDESPTTQVTI